jgi:hypothetical protein
MYQSKISLDTYHPDIAEPALSTLNVVINDLNGKNKRLIVDSILSINLL